MEFRKMVTMTLYARQQKRHRYKEQTFGLCGRRQGWDDLKKIALTHVYYHMWNRSPVQVQCMRQSAQGWCTGITLRDGIGREVGGGFRMGNTCTPMADSCQCMSKQLQYCKVISLQLKLKNKSNSGFPSDSVVKTLPANAGDLGSIPGSGRSPGEEIGNPL